MARSQSNHVAMSQLGGGVGAIASLQVYVLDRQRVVAREIEILLDDAVDAVGLLNSGVRGRPCPVDVSHRSAHVPEVKQEQAIAPQREIGPRQEQAPGLEISM